MNFLDIIQLKPTVFISFGLKKILRNFYRYAYFLMLYFFYKKIEISTFVSPLASVREHFRVSLGRNVVINRNVIIWATLTTGSHCQINPGTAIYGNVVLGNDVLIGPNVMIAGGSHGYSNINLPIRKQNDLSKGIIIGNDVWIGANAVLIDGITVGSHSIIGAGAVVLSSFPPYSVVAGNPGKLIRMRNNV